MHRLAGGAPDDLGVAVRELDGQSGVTDQHGDRLVLVDLAEGDLLPGDHDDPVLEGRRCTRIGSVEGRGGAVDTKDMDAGELEPSILLATYPEVVRPGDETGDWAADNRSHLLTIGMAGYAKSESLVDLRSEPLIKAYCCLAVLCGPFSQSSQFSVIGPDRPGRHPIRDRFHDRG